jgi:hypothetical protein
LALALKYVEVAGRLITCVSTAEVLLRKELNPLYCAVMECEPAVIGDTVISTELLAGPAVIDPLPTRVLPSYRLTFPDGEPPNAGTTATLNRTGNPAVYGFEYEVTTVVVGSAFTT